ncbi:hypothetical protein ABH19_10680 [Leptospirillum sp. Group II 'CF-1']|jgi:hypothetical protein|uniref:hypothetical protein n=1 Tax=Leptospirillum sp. Group II 'CF-1' TaxID=1660083 RepID=UPI0002EBDBEE|nr:hypothetical protein [Leptospirillum sp. Group II 'CF-1']AKS24104.1 hypothetical protein ABH19_10680 [Leptospirillum sp. Group II 'CF-1']
MMEAIALHPLRSKSTGAEWLPGQKVEASEEKLRSWAEQGLVRIVETDPSFPPSQLFSNGKPTGANLADPPLIRVYAWCLVNLRFAPILSSPTDFSRAAEECRLSIGETREAFRKLLKDGDLEFERERGRDYYWLAPIRWGDQG